MRPIDVFHRIAEQPGAVWLDGGSAPTGWSILSFNPKEIVTQADDWREAGRAFSEPYTPSELPFEGGAIGYIGYGAGPAISPVPASDTTWEPEIWLGHYPGALCFEHDTQGSQRSVEMAFLIPANILGVSVQVHEAAAKARTSPS